ncbi:MAG: fibronectin type III domain-containing protein [Kofleriaceae bacterium]
MFRASLALVLVSGLAHADDGGKCVDVEFTPTDGLQIVVWLTDSTGNYKDTLYITQQTGTFGLGNRPGRFDFNSGPIWPYGRRITTFPVWSHQNGQAFPQVLYQNDTSDDPDACFGLTGTDYQQCGENNLSHPFNQSSRESHFCRPLMESEMSWDTGTCATSAYSDKGKLSMAFTTGYPPRTDITQTTNDSASVAMYKAMNPFDAVSQPTPSGGEVAHTPWPVPTDLPAGDYIVWVETSKEQDFNDSYNATNYPSPAGLFWSEYGVPYRGQPSVVYQVPIRIDGTQQAGTTSSYIGYGDPDGKDGNLRNPDSTITSDTPGTGAARLQLTADGNDMYRVRVSISENSASTLPGVPVNLTSTNVTSSGMSMTFTAPGIGTDNARVAGYEIRVRANDAMTADNFADSMPVTAKITPDDPGHAQTFDLTSLLPETDYWVGVRAYDGCHNFGDIAITHVVTDARQSGSVDACFVATAAYGSILANDVELLRHFRDSKLQTNVLGELGVEAYYTFGPAFAGVVGESDLMRSSARDALRPLVEWVRNLKF